MLNLRLSDIARLTGGRLHGADATVQNVATDSRQPQSGAMFIALKGEQFDAHDFVADAQQQGAIAALVGRQLDLPMAQVIVADTERALGAIATFVRAAHNAHVVGITGSNGKTTVKALVASILQRAGRTHVNAGNFNNEIGLPLTVLALPADAEFAVLEMGAGKPGDIAYLAAIAKPQIGLVNNIAAAHLERMGNLQGVATTKGAIYQTLPQDGVAIINADDAFAEFFAGLAGARRIVRFGIEHRADVSASVHNLGANSTFTLHTPLGDCEVDLPLSGCHNVMNALAASAIAIALDVPLETIKLGLENAAPVKGRLIRHTSALGWTLIDDTYNANPASTAAAIATLVLQPGEPWLVLGDMKELGADAAQLHAEIGALAQRSGVRRLFGVGELTRSAVNSFGADATHYPDQQSLGDALRREIHSGVVCLIKGSRSSAMEKIVTALLSANDATHGAQHAA
ncbi:UDP-N-acetylmuramoyl-tripeptide--D-alanyl-D-alanine ligase [Pseudolysobacter antarcticus]|uniref:UDP-N-acetylmuramoyl-tripeptide--D-alanyl-D-alanine ligase n=1 Tax=Pseudolysobacter antarcticus TaxID=2511995 RepID=A0A411HGJ1_9GAMM|nr:UDP-N-acetylmuramoyl-tripeptide--D-alanyl-D-alanine ligase [Pseudolysobacter antarcticus]QBB69564.1 UDP-N-acetylmuramoyl-tripeptide--D-alanyl-D-alanine ligase [Pseudolysobacter antarcticus]